MKTIIKLRAIIRIPTVKRETIIKTIINLKDIEAILS